MKDLVVGMGEILWDMLPEEKKLGGAPANFAYHVSQFGLPGCAVSAVGSDLLGKEILDTLEARKIDHRVATVAYPTGTVNVTLDGAGIPKYDITENVAWDHIPFTSELESLARRTKAVCFGSLAQRSETSRDTIRRFISAVPRTPDSLIVFDINLRQHFYSPEIIDGSINMCNILKINDEELTIVSRMLRLPGDDIKTVCRCLLDRYNLRALILTCGTDGSYIFTTDTTSFLPTPAVEVCDTVGAGDSFTAAFIASLLRGKPISEAHSTAVAVSAHVCTRPGAMPLLPSTLTR